jgi:hypothetical protein
METLESIFEEWRDRHRNDLKRHSEANGKAHSCLKPVELTGASVLSWCKEHNESPQDFDSKLYHVRDLIYQLDDALSPTLKKFHKERRGFWSHIDMVRVIQDQNKIYRECLLDRELLKNVADLYLSRPWMHNAYLDWVFTDSLIAAETVSTFEWLKAKRGGFSYALFDGNKFKMAIAKLMYYPIAIFLFWVLPGLGCWWLFSTFPTGALIVGSAYYALNIGWLVINLFRVAIHRLGGGKSFKQMAAELNRSAFATYDELREGTVHVPSLRRAVEKAKDNGVVWDTQLFCILDNVAQRNPSTWTVH